MTGTGKSHGPARVLLVGGTGFIGMRVAAALAAQGVTPRLFDLAPAIARTALPPGHEAVAGDVTCADSLAEAGRGCDGIVHLAGLMTVDCARDPAQAVRVNVLGSVLVFDLAARLGVPVAYLSSAGVFGPDSADVPQPMTLYGVTKLAVEGVARVWAADHGVPSLGLRPYIVYGPGISSGIAAGPSIALAASVRREPAVIGFSGRVGFVHVDDVARMLAAAMTRPMSGATVLTMAGDTRDMADFTAELARQSGWTGITVKGPPLRIPADLASDPVPDWLGPQPVTGIAAGIRATLAELRGQEA
ncbi:NAD-dependent epimerase/dehydratase family protein [Paracoccus shandongensis]|uniref:NAD-dependent epimerase/dehydratase family protein n=1 Tax=Paracoccus shandongensis TaxID=2816048 RepID=UPI001A8F3E4A|nr:NAD(P)-dependent oxidoreductase [Paracoccus shandongensis]